MQKDFIQTLDDLTNGLGKFSPLPGSDYEKNSKSMISDIERIEKSIVDWTADFHYKIAIAYRNFTAWYARGEERTMYLSRVISHLNEALLLDPSNIEIKSELILLLIEEKQIRDLNRALDLIKELENTNSFPAWLYSSKEKAQRWTNKVDLEAYDDYSNIEPTPAVFREKRTTLRKLIVDSLKDGMGDKDLAHKLYNLGLLVSYLYDGHHCNSGVPGYIGDIADDKIRKIKSDFNFDYMGRINGAQFLTDTDYKRIEKILKVNIKHIDLDSVKEVINKRFSISDNVDETHTLDEIRTVQKVETSETGEVVEKSKEQKTLNRRRKNIMNLLLIIIIILIYIYTSLEK